MMSTNTDHGRCSTLAEDVLRASGLKDLGSNVDEVIARRACERAASCLREQEANRAVWRAMRRHAQQHLIAAGISSRKAEQIVGECFGEPLKPAELLLEIGQDAELWRSEDGVAYATVDLEHGRSHYPVRSQAFQDWLTGEYLTLEGRAPTTANLKDVVRTLEARARFLGEKHNAFVRVGWTPNAFYLDLGDESRRAVEIGAGATYRIVSDPSVRFLRPSTMRPHPVPADGGSIDELKRFIHLDGDAFKLFVTAMVTTFRPRGPYFIVVAQGNQGSGKTTASRVFVTLTDPHKAPLRTPPASERDLAISALSVSVLGFDNLGSIPDWLSDALCRLATGGGFATRALFTNTDETVIEVQCTTMLNGIEDIVERPDAIDRSVILDFPSISSADRRTESSFWAEFEEARPRILGTLLNGVATAISTVNQLDFGPLPRMADAVAFAAASAPAFGWDPQEVADAYRRNQQCAIENALENHLVGDALMKLIRKSGGAVDTTAAELLNALNGLVQPDLRRERSWPGSPRAMANALKRIEPALARVGISVDRERGMDRHRTRVIRFRSIQGAQQEGGERPG